MKVFKNVMFKRIVIYLCCTLLFTSCLFMSYQVPVYAETTYEDLLKDAVEIACAAAGIWAVAQTGGAMAPLIIPYIEKLAGTGFDLYDYVTQDEENGTTTISADFVNLVLQAYKEYKEDNGEKFDGTLDYDEQNMRYIYGSSEYYLRERDKTTHESHVSGFESYYPVAFLLVPGTTEYKYGSWGLNTFSPDDTRTGFGGFMFYYGGNPDAANDGIILVNRYMDMFPQKPSTVMYTNGVAKNPIDGFWFQNIGGPGVNDPYFISFNSSTIPVYTSFDMMKEAFYSGDYSHAENYSVGTSSCETPSYTGEYNGGDITVLTSSLDALRDKIAELEASNESLEEKLKELLEWLKLTGGGSGGGGGDVTVDIDLSTTNGWLSKIYEKVSQIFDKISGGLAGTGGNILQESLDAVLAKLDELNVMLKKYLSEITGDLDDIKGQLANMSEQEFEQKSDSFLGEVMDAFSEISEVVKTKFPFSIPNDLRIFLSRIAPAPPEAEAALYLDDTSSVSLYSGEHGGGRATDGEPNPPGGGGASRPGSSFVGVEHGGGGGSREPAEMREAPVFRLPIVIERYGIEEYIVIDMAPFDPLSRFSRSFFTIIFMVCLFNLTFKVIGMWGDIVG